LSYESQAEDVLYHRRKTKLNLDESFLYQSRKDMEFRTVKRRRQEWNYSEENLM